MITNLIPYMSYWSGGYQSIPSEMVINLHKLSAYFLKLNFGEVHFITDTQSAEYFKDIPWSSVSTELDEIDISYSPVWSLSKLYAYKTISQKGEPFVHVDYDVFLYKGLESRLLSADLFAQHPENAIHFFYEVDKFEKCCPNLHLIKDYKVEDAVNVGVLGGRDTEFLNVYASKAIEFILDPANKDFWLNYKTPKHNHWTKAVIAEQYYLAVMLKKYKKEIQFVFPNGWPTEEEAKEKNYIHLMCAKRRNDMEGKIKQLIKKYNL
jgi:hypothetical protein